MGSRSTWRHSTLTRGGGAEPLTRETGDAVPHQLGPQHEQDDEHDDGVVVRHELFDVRKRALRLVRGQHIKHDRPGHGEGAEDDEDSDGDSTLAGVEANLGDGPGGGYGRGQVLRVDGRESGAE